MIINRPNLAFIHDVAMATVAFFLSLFLRLGDDILFYPTDQLFLGGIFFLIVAAIVFRFMGMYRGVWRYASLSDLLNITKASTLTILVFIVILFSATRLDDLPRSLPFINWFVLIALLGGPRFLYRLFKDRRLDFYLEKESHFRIPVLLLGAGNGAELFIRDISRSDSNYSVAGIVADSESRVGRDIHGIRIIGTIDEIPEIVRKLKEEGTKPQRLVVTSELKTNKSMAELFEVAHGLGMSVARLPSLSDFQKDVSDGIVVKPIDVEDLLGRPQTPLDETALKRLVNGKKILISGAGGSIGAELVRQLSDLDPMHVSLLDNCEYNLFRVDLELGDRCQNLSRKAIFADIRDSRRVNEILSLERPDIVFHAAALKHVPMVEENILEGVATNILGTFNLAEAARAHKVATFVQISTDKAVNPTSVMGATKRVAEQYCQSLNMRYSGVSHTRFVTVRFGNVLGSTGSVVELFKEQLANGGPLTVTHPSMTRYFMTINESVALVLQAAAFGSNQDRLEGAIFVLEMGNPVKIVDLAKQMIRLAGLVPNEDISIEITGIRKGEKLFEEVLHGSEAPVPSDCEGLLIASPRTAELEIVTKNIAELEAAVNGGDEIRATELLRQQVPEYNNS